MTTTTTTATSRTPVLAATAFGYSAVLTAIGTFWAPISNDTSDHGTVEYLIVLGIAAVAAAVVFGLGVRSTHAARRSVVLGALSVVSIVVFWAGLPAVFAGGSITTALLDKDQHARFSKVSMAGLVLSGLALVAATGLAFAG